MQGGVIMLPGRPQVRSTLPRRKGLRPVGPYLKKRLFLKKMPSSTQTRTESPIGRYHDPTMGRSGTFMP